MRRPLFTFPIPLDTLNSLLKAGFKTYEDLFNVKSEPDKEALEIFKLTGYPWSMFMKEITPPPFLTAADILKEERECASIPTLSEGLDNVLGGGISVGSLIQVCGPPGSGKTQLVMQLCLSVQIPESLGSVNSSAVFIDSEGSFSLSRLTEMSEALFDHCKQVCEIHGLTSDIQGLTVENLLSRVNYIQVSSHIELLAAIYQLEDLLTKSKLKLVVLDSIVMPLLAVSNTLDRTGYLARIINLLRNMAEKHKIAIVVCNDLTTWIAPNGDKHLIPALGESCSHLTPTILLLAKHAVSHHSALLYKSSSLPQRSANFKILKEGIRD